MSALPAQAEFEALLQRARDGDQTASRQLHDLYAHHVRRVIRRHLLHKLRIRVDSVDLLQEVWQDFFCKALPKQTFRTPEALLAFLMKVAHDKVADSARAHLGCQKNDLRRQQSLSDQAGIPKEDLTSPDPGPDRLAEVRDQWQTMMAGQSSPDRSILEMLRDGCTHQEIAGELGLQEKSVRRLLASLQSA